MKLLPFLLSVPLVLGEKLVIPEVENAVSAQLKEFSKYTAYTGPTGAAKSAALAPTPKVFAQVLAASPAAAAATPYWYETIAHQGKAAHNPNTTYAIFRNVKSYGAKG